MNTKKKKLRTFLLMLPYWRTRKLINKVLYISFKLFNGFTKSQSPVEVSYIC
jgi:hypothetical protein